MGLATPDDGRKATSIGFLIGWLGGIVMAVVVFALLASFLPLDSNQSSRWRE